MTSTLLRTLCIASIAVPAAAAEGVFEDVSVYDALALARRAKRVVLVAWTRTDDPQCRRMDQVWADPSVEAWVKQHTVAVQIDGQKEARQAQNWSITAYPTTLLLKPNGKPILRTAGFRSAKDFLIEAEAAVQAARAGESNTITEPSGEDAQNPEAWLAYANALFVKNDPDPSACLNAYLWCLDQGEIHSPGFLDTYLDLILRRVISLDNVSGSKDQLRQRRDDYSRALAEGYGTPASLRAILTISHGLREPRQAMVALEIVTGASEPDPVMVRIAVDGVVETLVGQRRYKEALEHAGDIVARARTESEELRQTMDGKTPGAGASATMEAKREFVELYGLYYEALLGVGKGADASAVAQIVMDTVPTGNACATLIGHARRLDLTAAAEKLAEAGLAQVRSDKGKKMIQRALTAGKVGLRRTTQEEMEKALKKGLGDDGGSDDE